MTDLAPRRPQSVAEHAEIDYNAALRHLGLRQDDPKAHALVLVCARYGLDPLLGHVSIYKDKPYIHFAGYLHIANSNPHFQGVETVREWEDERYCYATVRVHRDDRSFPAERTGKSLKNKPRSGGGTYLDEDADAKAFAQATRRALRLAFVIDHPDPVDDHGGEQPAPAPVVEVARMVGGPHMSERLQEYEPSGAGEREPTISPDSRDLRHDPAPGSTSGEVGERETTALASSRPLRHDPTSPDPTSDPWGLSPLAPRADQTSPPVESGEGFTGGDSNPSDSEPEVGEAIPLDDEGEGSDGSGGQPARAVAKQVSDGSVTTDPTPPADPSPVQAWASEHGHDIRLLRVYLKRNHPDEFGDMKDRLDLDELRPPRSDKAIAYLEAAFLRDDGDEG